MHPRCQATLTVVGRYARALEESLIAIFNRVEAVRKENDMLGRNNKFLQENISELLSRTKTPAPDRRDTKRRRHATTKQNAIAYSSDEPTCRTAQTSRMAVDELDEAWSSCR